MVLSIHPSPGAVIASVEGLSRTLLQLHHGRGLTIDVNVSAEHCVRGQREDLDEMLGNLLDNACKWANSRIAITVSVERPAKPALPNHLQVLIDNQLAMQRDNVPTGREQAFRIELEVGDRHPGDPVDPPLSGTRRGPPARPGCRRWR